jgi:hypothetical protein
MPRSKLSRITRLGLRAGDWVIVRSQEEILATLDKSGRLDGLPFQPEMFAYCGRRLQVAKRAHKTCDSSEHRTGGRRMYDTVHLQNARCDGALHDGCQADCVFFWKEAWLRRDDGDRVPPLPPPVTRCTEADVMNARYAAGSEAADPTWVCQTTAVYEASDPLHWWDVRQYVQDVTSGNHSAWHIIKLLVRQAYRHLVHVGIGYRALIAFYDAFQKLRGGEPFPTITGLLADGAPTPTAPLHLQPGEWVEVKSKDEIAKTITRSGFNRGMRYDLEMLKYSGKRYRVQKRIDKIINEKNGKMAYMKTPLVQLENVYCRAECTDKRIGCPRASSTYWREIWLERAAPSRDAQV